MRMQQLVQADCKQERKLRGCHSKEDLILNPPQNVNPSQNLNHFYVIDKIFKTLQIAIMPQKIFYFKYETTQVKINHLNLIMSNSK